MKNEWIRINRLNFGISQFKMAKALGITNQLLSSWELEKTYPNEEQIKMLESFFSKPDSFFSKVGITKKKKIVGSKKNIKTSHEQGLTADKLSQFYEKIKTPTYQTNKKLNAVMLFSGIGGMSLGFKQAGFNIIGHSELNKSAEEIYKLNFPESQLIGNDIRDISNDQALAFSERYGEITVMAGGPPCQGFSLAGKRNIFDPRNELFKEFARLAKIIRPKFIVLENVKTLLTMNTKDGGLVSDYLIKDFSEAGYILKYKILNTKNYGVPQSRERVVFIGVREDILKSDIDFFPEETHGIGKKPYETFRSTTKDLDSLESGERSKSDPLHFAISHPIHVINMLKDVPEGKSAHENSDPNLRPSSGYNTTYKRITWDEPCSTISTNFSMISGSRNVHPENTRSLTIREALRCQTFPDYFRLDGSLGDMRTGIGNAVPPRMANLIAEHIKSIHLDDKNSHTGD